LTNRRQPSLLATWRGRPASATCAGAYIDQAATAAGAVLTSDVPLCIVATNPNQTDAGIWWYNCIGQPERVELIPQAQKMNDE
jgi:hypothetical protein